MWNPHIGLKSSWDSTLLIEIGTSSEVKKKKRKKKRRESSLVYASIHNFDSPVFNCEVQKSGSSDKYIQEVGFALPMLER